MYSKSDNLTFLILLAIGKELKKYLESASQVLLPQYEGCFAAQGGEIYLFFTLLCGNYFYFAGSLSMTESLSQHVEYLLIPGMELHFENRWRKTEPLVTISGQNIPKWHDVVSGSAD